MTEILSRCNKEDQMNQVPQDTQETLDPEEQALIDKGNQERADRVRRILDGHEVYREAVSHDGYETAIGDLLADMMHLAQINGLNWAEIAEQAADHHEAEQTEP